MTVGLPKIWVIDNKDNVGTVICEDITGAMQVLIVGCVGETEQKLAVQEPVPYGHKVALVDIEMGECVIKYGVTIGRLVRDVHSGETVHVHNLESLRGRGDLA